MFAFLLLRLGTYLPLSLLASSYTFEPPPVLFFATADATSGISGSLVTIRDYAGLIVPWITSSSRSIELVL